jgi:hypothetical protein
MKRVSVVGTRKQKTEKENKKNKRYDLQFRRGSIRGSVQVPGTSRKKEKAAVEIRRHREE